MRVQQITVFLKLTGEKNRALQNTSDEPKDADKGGFHGVDLASTGVEKSNGECL